MRHSRIHWFLLVCLLASPASSRASGALACERGVVRVLAGWHHGFGTSQYGTQKSCPTADMDEVSRGREMSVRPWSAWVAARALPSQDFAAQPAGP